MWNTSSSKLIHTIENVQRRATKQVPGLGEMSYEERLRKLGLPTLVYRRMRGDAIECYKMLNNNEDVVEDQQGQEGTQ